MDREPRPSTAGRRGHSLGTVDVGGSHLHAALVDDEGHAPVLRRRLRTDVDAGADRETLLAAIAAPLAHLGASSWAVALPGPFDYPAGRGDFTGVGKFASLAGVDLRAELAHRLAVEPSDVQFLNDAEAYGLGEWWTGSARPRRSVLVTLGTGVGSAFLVDGDAVDSGPGVPPHGWVHLLHIDGAPLEDVVSTRAVVATFTRRTGRAVEVREIAAEARAGAPVARDVLASAMRALGAALGPGLVEFCADELVVGGSISRSWDVIEGPLRSALVDSGCRGLVLRPSALLDDAPLLGAAWWFRRRWSASRAPTR